MKLFVLTAAVVVVATSALAQDAWPSRKTCSVSTPAAKGQPTIRFNSFENNGKATRRIEIFADSKLDGALENVRIELTPTAPVEGLKGTSKPYGKTKLLTIDVPEGWDSLLRKVSTAHEIIIRAGAETFTAPLAGSSAAVIALRACSK